MKQSSPSSLVSGVIYALSPLAAISLGVTALVLFVNAFDFPRPMMQLPAIIITLTLAIPVFIAPRLLHQGKRSACVLLLAGSTAVVVTLPLVRYVPLIFVLTYNRFLEDAFPPLWPYSASIPLLLLATAEVALPSSREDRPSGISLGIILIAATLLLFFSSILIADMSYHPKFFGVPSNILISLGVSLGLVALLIIGAIFPRKGLLWQGIVLLGTCGLFIEMASIAFYTGPPWYVGIYTYQTPTPNEPFFPLVPFLGGTLPGALTFMAAFLLWRNKYLEEKETVTASSL